MYKPLIFGSGASSFKGEEDLMKVLEAAVSHGIMCFDTAPSYGTEKVLSRCLSKIANMKGIGREQLKIQTKIDPIQMYQGDVVNYFIHKLRVMGLEYVDVLLMHWPVYKYFKETWEAMNQLKGMGLAKRLGICNLRAAHLRELQSINILPEILQIERHPLNTFEEERLFCVKYNIDLQDYSPLCKMHPLLKNNQKLQKMAERYGKSIGNLILRWHIDTFATPIFTSKNVGRIAEYSSVDEFCLQEEDVAIINALNINHKLYLESLVCPGF